MRRAACDGGFHPADMTAPSKPLGLAALLAAALCAVSSPAFGADVGSPDSLASVEVHAFASQGFILSKDNNYLSARHDARELPVLRARCEPHQELDR